VSNNIFTAVITAPRPKFQTLHDTLASLQDAGFDPPLVIHDEHQAGCYVTWRLAARWALHYHVHQLGFYDFILICEDDIELAAGLRQWLQHEFAPPNWLKDRRRFVASLYTARCNHRDVPGWHAADRLPKQASGALALLFPVKVLSDFLADPPHPEWADRTDHAVGLFCREKEIPFLFHSPSLVRHTDPSHTNSALVTPGGRIEDRQCEEFAGFIHSSISNGGGSGRSMS